MDSRVNRTVAIQCIIAIVVIVVFTSLMNIPGSFAQWSGFSYPYSFGAYNYGYGYPYSYQQIGYPFDYPASLFPWPTNLPGVNHPLGAILNWPWNQAFDVIFPPYNSYDYRWGPPSESALAGLPYYYTQNQPFDTGSIPWQQWSPYYQGGNPYGDGLYSPLGIPPSSYDPYGPTFMPGVGWINPYQTIPNPFSITGVSMYIPDWGLWPPSTGSYNPFSGPFWPLTYL